MRMRLLPKPLFLTIALAAAAGLAQNAPGPVQPAPGTIPQQPPPTIVVPVIDVRTPVTVQDSSGEIVLSLSQRDFHIFDNGVEQSIEGFDVAGEPISATLIFETSSKIASYLPELQKTGILFTQNVLGTSGEAAVLGYNDTVDHLQGFTEDHDQIEKIVKHLQPSTSGTRLYDALSQAVTMLRNQPISRRRVIIVLSDGSDSASEEPLSQVLREAQVANITIYTVGLSPMAASVRGEPKSGQPPSATPPGIEAQPPIPGTAAGTDEGPYQYGNVDLLGLPIWAVKNAVKVIRQRPLEVAAAASGGLYQPAMRDRSIEQAIDEIGAELNGQYILTYHPSGQDIYGYHEIKVKIDVPDLKIRTRPGYYLQKPGS
ncbi:MAG: VWA domain-containing protein [Candidatus Acidiferrales bacterium]